MHNLDTLCFDRCALGHAKLLTASLLNTAVTLDVLCCILNVACGYANVLVEL